MTVNLIAMAQRQFQALQNEPNIAHFLVEGTTTGRQLGIGSYGSVEEVVIRLLIILEVGLAVFDYRF